MNGASVIFGTATALSLIGSTVPAWAVTDRAAAAHWTSPYNIVWTNQSADARGSMPCGAGNLGLNVWVEKDELLVYLGSPDAWSDRGLGKDAMTRWCSQVQTKLGRLRVSFAPIAFAKDFRQELDLGSNSILVSGRTSDSNTVALRIWVDAFQPVVYVEAQSERPLEVAASVEFMRGEGRLAGDAVEWWQRNPAIDEVRNDFISQNKVEELAALIPDPMAKRTMGGRFAGRGFVADGLGEGSYDGIPFRFAKLKSATPLREFDLRASLRIAQDSTPEQWQTQAEKLDVASRRTVKADWKVTTAWWREFWNRSRIVINPGKGPEDPAWRVGRNYQLFRAMLASNRTGEFPTLFNGGHFLCEGDTDRRNWAFCQFMSQNQRLVYWPMLRSGDFDLLKVGLDFYRRHAGLQAAWAKHFWHVDGLAFPEGLGVYGIEWFPNAEGRSGLDHLPYHHISGMEFVLMMLEAAAYSGDDVRASLPVAEGYLKYYDQFYRQETKKRTGKELDDNGHLVIFPGNGIEMYQGTRNDVCSLSGLMALSEALLALPAKVMPAERRAFCASFRKTLPPLPTRERRGHQTLAPAESWQGAMSLDNGWENIELPELYPVFPFRIYGVGRPGLELARDTWAFSYTKPGQKKNLCWYQSLIYTADLGLVEEASEFALGKFLWPEREEPKRASDMRYPGFWDTFGFCQRPDFDHGGCAMIGLQDMLLQTVNEKILLFPAWPKEWDVSFKLHASRNTTVEGELRDGKVTSLVVTPKSRTADVVNMLAK
jgi:hypothetical protein